VIYCASDLCTRRYTRQLSSNEKPVPPSTDTDSLLTTGSCHSAVTERKNEHLAPYSTINVQKTEVPKRSQDRKPSNSSSARLHRNDCSEIENCDVQKRRKSLRRAVLKDDVDSCIKSSEKQGLIKDIVENVESAVQYDSTTDATADVAGKELY
jgi:hypothetical protein